MRFEQGVRRPSLWRGIRWTVSVLIPACVLVTILAGPVLAIPYCWQINASWCQVVENCTASIQWRTCQENGQRQWRCVWKQGQTYCQVSQWNWCWCDGYGPPGGCDCLLADAPITLADGSTKPVQAIRKGDRLLAYDEPTATTKTAEVVSVHAPYLTNHYFVINEAIRITGPHPVLSGGKWVSASELRLGDLLTAADGSSAPVLSLRKVEEKVMVYNFQVEGGTYVAHGIIVHNKENCETYEVPPCSECSP